MARKKGHSPTPPPGWIDPRIRYITGNESLRAVVAACAGQKGCGYSNISLRASAERWAEERAKYRALQQVEADATAWSPGSPGWVKTAAQAEQNPRVPAERIAASPVAMAASASAPDEPPRDARPLAERLDALLEQAYEMALRIIVAGMAEAHRFILAEKFKISVSETGEVTIDVASEDIEQGVRKIRSTVHDKLAAAKLASLMMDHLHALFPRPDAVRAPAATLGDGKVEIVFRRNFDPALPSPAQDDGAPRTP